MKAIRPRMTHKTGRTKVITTPTMNGASTPDLNTKKYAGKPIIPSKFSTILSTASKKTSPNERKVSH